LTTLIFHNEQGREYGAEYPEQGTCAQSIQSAENFIEAAPDRPGMWKFMDDTVADVLRHPSTQRKDFKLYVMGYAHLFNDGPESAWCDDKSFTVNMKELIRSRTPFGGDPRVKLTQAIRACINDLTTKMNAQIENVIRYRNDPRVVYISVTEAFNGHRFCEGNSNWYRQYFGTDSWFWNASPDDLFNVGNQAVDGAKYAEALMNQASINNKWNAAYNSTELFESSLQEWDWQDLLATEKGPAAMSPHQGASPGIALRPFHPKQYGHAAISEILRARAVEDFTSGCSPACPWN
jgi:hypothetical protein